MTGTAEWLTRQYFPGREFTDLTVRNVDDRIGPEWLWPDWQRADLAELRGLVQQREVAAEVAA